MHIFFHLLRNVVYVKSFLNSLINEKQTYALRALFQKRLYINSQKLFILYVKYL